MWDNTAVGGHNPMCGGISYNSVCGHIPVQIEKYYIIRIKKWLFGNRLLHLYTELLALGRKIYIFKLIYRYFLAFGR
jgi:hypothetical protein